MPVKIRGNEYTTVAERVAAIHNDHPQISILTEIVDETDIHITIKSTIKIVKENVETIYNGHAREYFELENQRAVNFAFAVENAETSAIGRALSAAGYGGSRYASAEEMRRIDPKTIVRQSQIDAGKVPLLKAVEKARQRAEITINELKEKSREMFGTDQIRDLSEEQLEKFALRLKHNDDLDQV